MSQMGYNKTDMNLEFNTREPTIAIESAQACAAFDVPEHHLRVPAGRWRSR